MGWSIGWDEKWKRDIGYGVPATCDHPKCKEAIDRGLSYVCGGEPYGGDDGCGLFFCSNHLFFGADDKPMRCGKCRTGRKPYEAKPDAPEWIVHKLTDESWAEWRKENPDWVEEHWDQFIAPELQITD